jgi:putative heme-binding domain-containing protein
MYRLMVAGQACLWMTIFLAIDSGQSVYAQDETQQNATAKWIWHTETSNNQTIFLRREWNIESDVQSAKVSASADNGFKLFINGQLALEGIAWEQLETADIKTLLKAGRNQLAVQATNQGGIAAFTLQAEITNADGGKSRLITDEKWKSSAKSIRGWKILEHDESDWQTVKLLGKVGAKNLPWSRQITPKEFAKASPGGSDSGNDFLPQSVDTATVKEGFQLEKLVHVPRSMGSWVALTTAANGTLIASDQGKAGLYRITPSIDGGETKVQKIPVELSGAQGLLWAFDSLYAVVNGGDQSGLHRITDTDGDGELDSAEHLKFIQGGGEHGPHAVILSADKQSLFVCCGNHTELPEDISDSKIPRNWGEDHLLPRRWDANGHAAGKLAPGGWICQVDPDGNDWTVYSMGYRNQYDIAINSDGELFSYDADMEWDLGSPWYRPTRVVHATSGSEFGWRSGTGKWPTYYEDSLPPAVDIGPGSPVGIVFGYGAKFPAKYQKALFILDWTYSTIYAVHLTPNGSSYQGEKEDFVSGQPLQVTDATIGNDGALYFTAGGRGTQSSLYRVTYTGDESIGKADASNAKGQDDRQLRRKLESWHGETQATNLEPLDQIIAQLGNDDRFIRYAARIALETRPVDSWRDRLGESDSAWAIINEVIALSRQGSESDREPALTMLMRLANMNLSQAEELGALRALQLIFTRLGEPSEVERRAVLAALSPLYPAESDKANAELIQLLVFLDDPTVVNKTLSLMDNLGDEPVPDWGYLVQRHKGYGGTVGKLLENMPPTRGIHLAFMLRNQKSGWTLDNRRKYLQFFIDASKFPGGNSYGKFLSQFRDDALLLCSPTERVQLEDLVSVSLMQAAPKVDPPQGPGRKWTRDEALPLVTNLRKRDLAKGRNLFHATSCAKCHRLSGEGGAIGPDLSTAGRKYPLPDLLDAIIDPSKAISDQYGSEKILTTDGDTLVGRVVRIDGKLHVYTIDADAKPKVIDEEDVEQIAPSKLSQMPTGLIDTLNEEELKDLVAYLLSGGNRKDKVYK